MISRLVAHFSRYSLANVAVTLAGIISFPILTRIFTISEYGLLSLVGVMLSVAVAVGKLGLQHAALRFFSEIRAGRSPYSMAQYEATVVYGLAASGAVAALLWLIWGEIFASFRPDDADLAWIIAATAGLVFMQCLNSAIVNQIYAREQSNVLSIYTVLRRYLILACTLGTLFLISPTLLGFYAAMLVAEAIATIGIAAWFLRRHPAHPSRFSPALLLAMLAFGSPLIVSELASVMVSLGDRFVIQGLLGEEAVGIYSAPYNLCEYISGVLVVAFTGAIQPMVLRLWADKGQADTERFLRDATHVYALVAIPVAAGVSAIGASMLAVFASTKFAPGAVVIPWVIAGLALHGLFPVAAASLYVRKQSGRILTAVLISAVANIVLNLLLIPPLGILGAGIATTASYLAMLASARYFGRGLFTLDLDWLRIARFALAAAVMVLAVNSVAADSHMSTLILKILLGMATYPLVLLGIDRASREMLTGFVARLRPGART